MTKTGNQVLRRISFIIGAISIGLAIWWFGWHLLVVLVLFIWANNIERATY